MQKGKLLILCGLLLFPSAASANGGIKEVAEGKYMVNLSAAPIAPYVGEKQSMLIGFADIYGNLVEKDISVDLTLKYQSVPILDKINLIAENGVLPFQYTYDKPGFYELFIAFRLPDEPDHTYMPEDFMIDVKEKYVPSSSRTPVIAGFLGGGILGIIVGFLFARIRSLPHLR